MMPLWLPLRATATAMRSAVCTRVTREWCTAFCLHAFRRLHDLNDATRFGGWLAAIARSRANDHRRRLQTATAVKQVLAMRAAEAPRMSHPTEISAEKILELIRTLPDAYRETLILRLVEGMTGPEIAAHTGLTPGSVRVNLHRGMQQLREKMCRSRMTQ